jgi:glycerophosphoryl diester phosphodiesterase
MKITLAPVLCLTAMTALAEPLKLVSHAGDQFSAPGHSIPAYRAAIELKADILKLDLHLTRDRVIVLMHDKTTGRKMDRDLTFRLTDYPEILRTCTYREVGGFDKEKIVRLDQALELVKDAKLSFWLDMKGFTVEGQEDSELLAEKTMELTRKYGIGKERLMVATYRQPALKYMKRHYPEIRRVLHVSMTDQKNGLCRVNSETDHSKRMMKPETILPHLLEKAKELDLYGFNLPISSRHVTRELVRQLQEKGYWISVWFVQDKETAVIAVQLGADAAVTDNLKEVRPAVRNETTAGRTK